MVRRWVVLLAVILPGGAFAQVRVSESDYLAVLTKDYPGLSISAEQVGVAQAERTRAGLLLNPTLSVERESPRDSPEQLTGQISWTPPLDGRRGAAVRAANAGLRAATHRSEADQLLLRSELRQAFAEWAISFERDQIVETHLTLIRRMAEQMRARVTSGEESGLAAKRLALAALEVEAEAARTSASARRARASAFAWNGSLAPDAQPALPILPDAGDTLAPPMRADLLARNYEVEQADWQLRASKRFLQFPEIAFGWQRIHDDIDTEGPVLGLSWPLPLFDRLQPERIEASTRLAAARARLQLSTARAQAELVASRSSYVLLRQSAVGAMRTAGESLSVVESATATFRLGESRLTDLLETLRSALSARLAALDLYAAALEAHRSLELAVGRPLGAEGTNR